MILLACSRRFQSLRSPNEIAAFSTLRRAALQLPPEILGSGATFAVAGSNVRPIDTPANFYEALKSGIRNARRRIVLSSLYIGSEQTDLTAALREALASNSSLRVDILIDALRGTRTKGGQSSVTLLHPLVREFGERANVSLYHTPAMGPALKAVLPDRFREAFGLQHMKVYLFDDDLILSGANLNTDYFVNRQDRYVMFGNCLDLAEYYAGLVRAVSSLSYRLNANGMVLPSATPDPGRQSAKFVRFSKGHLESFLREWADKTRPVRDRLRRTPETDGVSDKEDTLVVPFFQQGQFGLDEDERMITSLLTHFIDNSRHPWRVHFTSGYLNFAHGFRQLLLAQTSSTKYNILTASPEANGWFGSHGVSRYIPDAYRMLERNIIHQIEECHLTDRIQVSEWSKPGWTFHCKGLWAQRDDELEPGLTLIGSTNYGQRSMTRDVESEVMILTSNQGLKRRLKDEYEKIYTNGKRMTYGALPPPGLFVRFATPVLQKYF